MIPEVPNGPDHMTPDEFRACPDPVVQAFVDRAAAEAALDMVTDTYV